MNIKLKIAVIGLLSSLIFSFFSFDIYAKEVDSGLVIIDRTPWKISWIQEEKDWVLIAKFDKGTLKTYFKNEPPAKGFGLCSNKKPVKQEFEFYLGAKITSTNFQYEQWPDGAKAYAFEYNHELVIDGKKFKFGTTAIIEEMDAEKNEIRYAIFREFE